MRLSRILWTAAAAFLCMAQASQAAPCALDYGEAVELAGRQLRELEASRAVVGSAEELRGDVEVVVDTYLSHPQAPGDPRPRGLLFFIADRQAVCSLYWEHADDAGGFFVSAQLPISSTELRSLISQTVASVIGTPTRPERAPHLRDDEPQSRAARPLDATAGRRPVEPALAALSQALFSPEIASRIETLASLSIVPALNVGTVPFSALDPNEDGQPLVETTAVNIEESFLADSAQAFGWSGDQISVKPLIVGDPDATRDPDWLLPRLPAAGREAQEVARLLGGQPMIGAAATVAAVVARLADADYIHIAAHGLADIADPVDGSFLALTGGRLTARQIQNMTLAGAPLVVLSACQTGLGGTLEAGITGLARAFIIAGAFEVVASLWNIDDEATAFIMTRLVEHLRQHAPPVALRLAQSDGRQRFVQPAAWAPFILFGRRTVVQ